MRENKSLKWLLLCCFCVPLLVGCGLFGRSAGDVDQGVAFPPMAESPPTSESSLPRPIVLSLTEPAVTPTPTVSPTSAPPMAVPQVNQPLPAPTTTGPQVLSFTAETADNDPGKTIIFSWQSSGGKSARIYNGAESTLQTPVFWDVPVNGTLTVDILDPARSNPVFELFVYADVDLTIYDTALIEIEWPCATAYFFDSIPVICPESAVFTTAVEQRFENGRMILLQDLDWIYVLYDEVTIYGGPGGRGNLQWERYDDGWTGTGPGVDLATAPPAGYFAPTDNLGYLWRENDKVREKLGWALAPEVTFEGAWQEQVSENANNPAGSTDLFIQLQDGFVARLTGFDPEWGWVWITFGPFN